MEIKVKVKNEKQNLCQVYFVYQQKEIYYLNIKRQKMTFYYFSRFIYKNLLFSGIDNKIL